MTDIASLGLAIDSTAVRTAREDLRGMREAGVAAADSVTRLEQVSRSSVTELQALQRATDSVATALRQQSGALDDLISKVKAAAVEMTRFGGATETLVQATARVQALGQAFGTTAAGMESFSRAARQIGLDANETVSALQRIQAAMANLTAEGQQARRVLQDYGVSLRGAGPADAGRIAADFTRALRATGRDGRSWGEAQTVLGPLSLDTMTALTNPGFTTEAQRMRRDQAAAMDDAAALTRESAANRLRQVQRDREELADLRREFGGGRGQGTFEPDTVYADRLRQARADGAVSASATASQGWRGRVARMNARLSNEDPVFIANLAEIEARRQEERASASFDPFGLGSWARSQYRQSLAAYGYYEPQNLPVAAADPPERVGAFNVETGQYRVLAGLSPLERQQRDSLVGWGIQNGWRLPTEPLNFGLGELMEGLTPGQYSAAQARFGALDDVGNAGTARGLSQRMTVRSAFAGAAGGGLASASRAEQIAAAEIRVSEELRTAKGQEVARALALAEILSREADARTRATTAIETETQIRTNGTQAGLVALQGGASPIEAQAAGLRATLQGRADLIPGSASAAAYARQGFATAYGGVVAGVLAQRQGTDDLAQNFGATAGASSATELAEQVRLLEAQRQIRQAMVQAMALEGTERQRALAQLREMTDELRSQDRIQTLIGQNVAFSNAYTGTRAGSLNTALDLQSIGQGRVSTPADLARERFILERGEQLYSEGLPPAQRGAWGARSPSERQLLTRDWLAQPENAGRLGQLREEWEVQRRSAAPGALLRQRTGVAAAGVGVTGDPRARVAGARAQAQGVAAGLPESEIAANAAIASAQEAAGFTARSLGLIYGANVQGETALRGALRLGDASRDNAWWYEDARRIEAEINLGQTLPELVGRRQNALATEGGGTAALRAATEAVGFRSEAEELREQAIAAREGGNALEVLNRQLQIERQERELIARARAADTAAQKAKAAGDMEEAKAMEELADGLRQVAEGYRTAAEGRNQAGDEAAFGSERRRLGDSLQDLSLEAGAGWFRSNASVAREVTQQRYGREIRRRMPGLSDAQYGELTSQAAEEARLRSIAEDNRLIRDSFLRLGEAAGGALETIILRGGRAKDVMAALAADTASWGLRTLWRQGMQAAGDWFSGGSGGGLLGGGLRWLGGALGGGSAAAAASGGIGPVASVLTETLGPLASAQGNIFDRGFLIPMAQGAVVSSPTTRPMAGGNTALMGEAGPEGVFPLVRTASGNLGIRTSGGGGVFAPQLNISVGGGGGGGAGGGPELARQIAEEAMGGLKGLFAEWVQEQTRVGGTLNPVYGTFAQWQGG